MDADRATSPGRPSQSSPSTVTQTATTVLVEAVSSQSSAWRELTRRVPVRAGIYVATAAYSLVAHLLKVPLEVQLAIIGLAGAVVAGDTVRPSGHVRDPA